MLVVQNIFIYVAALVFSIDSGRSLFKKSIRTTESLLAHDIKHRGNMDKLKDNMSLEEIRLESIRQNAKIFSSFGFGELKEKMKRKKPPKSGLKKTVKQKPKMRGPDRRSIRIKNAPAISLNEDDLLRTFEEESAREYASSQHKVMKKRRRARQRLPPEERDTLERIPLSDALLEAGEKKSVEYLQDSVFGGVSASSTWITHERSDDLNSFAIKMKTELRMSEKSVAQVTPKRITCMTLHPSADKALVIAGSNDGVVGFWDVSQPQSSCVRIQHHEKLVTAVGVHPLEPRRVITTSYDGILCVTDINRRKVREAYASDQTSLLCMDFIEPNIIITGCNKGFAMITDLRAQGFSSGLLCHKNMCHVNTISVHPVKRGTLIAVGIGSAHSNFGLWDMRNMRKPLKSCTQLPRIEWCKFSPDTGSRLLTSTNGDRISISDTDKLLYAKTFTTAIRIKTQLYADSDFTACRPQWIPNREDCLVVGNASSPTEVQLFNALNREKIVSLSDPALMSIKSWWMYHPSMNILAGGDSSGRIHYFS